MAQPLVGFRKRELRAPCCSAIAGVPDLPLASCPAFFRTDEVQVGEREGRAGPVSGLAAVPADEKAVSVGCDHMSRTYEINGPQRRSWSLCRAPVLSAVFRTEKGR